MIRLFRLLLALMFLGMVALVSAVVTMHFAIHGGEVVVPELRNLPTQSALRDAAAAGLNFAIDNKYYSAEVPAGRVLTQFPLPGTIVRREWRVRVTESLGPQRVQIPNVIGQPERLATIEVRRAGLELGSVARMPYAYVTPGNVIAQNPAHGAAGVERPSVSLLVSAASTAPGPAYVMPQLVGLPAANAESALLHAGLKIGSIEDREISVPPVGATNVPQPAGTANGQAAASSTPAQPPANPVPPGTVLAQSPPSGHRVDATTPVTLTVAR